MSKKIFKMNQEDLQRIVNLAKQSGMEEQKVVAAKEQISLSESKINELNHIINNDVSKFLDEKKPDLNKE